MSEKKHRLSWEKVAGWLAEAPNYWLGTTHADGRPHLSQFEGIWQPESDQMAFYFYADPESWTAHNLTILPFAILQLQEEERVVLVEGKVRPELAPPGDRLQPVAAHFANKYRLPESITHDRRVLFRLEAQTARVWQLDISAEPLVFDLTGPEPAGVESATDQPTTATPDQPPQPTAADNPGSNAYPYDGVHEDTWEIWHSKYFVSWSTKVHLFAPQTGTVPPGGFGVLAVSPGFELGSVSYYRQFLEHVARKGYIVLFVVTQAFFLDDDHLRQAGEFLEAVQDALANHFRPGEVDPQRVGWWGHSIGCKVQALASQLTGSTAYIKPAFIIGAAYSDQKIIHRADALTNAADTPAEVAYTLLPGDADDIAPAQESLALFEAMPQLNRRQVIQVSSYQADGLIANHAAPMTSGRIPVIGTPAEVDALDWYGYWKWTVGALDYHFKGQTDSWIYGAERLNGGTDKLGHQILHVQLAASPD